jgi:hypothetical protein
MIRESIGLAALVLILALGGCARTVGYRALERTEEIDPANGDTLITQFWRYDNAESTVTFKRIPHGSTDRRRDAPPPAARFSD